MYAIGSFHRQILFVNSLFIFRMYNRSKSNIYGGEIMRKKFMKSLLLTGLLAIAFVIAGCSNEMVKKSQQLTVEKITKDELYEQW